MSARERESFHRGWPVRCLEDNGLLRCDCVRCGNGWYERIVEEPERRQKCACRYDPKNYQ